MLYRKIPALLSTRLCACLLACCSGVLSQISLLWRSFSFSISFALSLFLALSSPPCRIWLLTAGLFEHIRSSHRRRLLGLSCFTLLFLFGMVLLFLLLSGDSISSFAFFLSGVHLALSFSLFLSLSLCPALGPARSLVLAHTPAPAHQRPPAGLPAARQHAYPSQWTVRGASKERTDQQCPV